MRLYLVWNNKFNLWFSKSILLSAIFLLKNCQIIPFNIQKCVPSGNNTIVLSIVVSAVKNSALDVFHAGFKAS